MAHIREVARKKAPNGITYEVHWREGDKKMQRTFTVRREAERFALKVETAKEAGGTTKTLCAQPRPSGRSPRPRWTRAAPA